MLAAQTHLIGLSGRLVDGVNPSLYVAQVVCAQIMRLASVLDQANDVLWFAEFVCKRRTETLQVDATKRLNVLYIREKSSIKCV